MKQHVYQESLRINQGKSFSFPVDMQCDGLRLLWENFFTKVKKKMKFCLICANVTQMMEKPIAKLATGTTLVPDSLVYSIGEKLFTS